VLVWKITVIVLGVKGAKLIFFIEERLVLTAVSDYIILHG